MTKNKKLPKPKLEDLGNGRRSLPFTGSIANDKTLLFSFSSFDRMHKLFNLGGNSEDKTVGGQWFLKLLDCLKSVSSKSITELTSRSTHDLHPIDWSRTNTKPPAGYEQLEYWQFRIDKSSGRVIGVLINNVFYVVWLDPHHNLTDSEGYGTARKYSAPSE